MIEGSVAKRAGTPDEVGAVGALLMEPDRGFITGSDFLMDGGVTAAYWYGDVAEVLGALRSGLISLARFAFQACSSTITGPHRSVSWITAAFA
jgi:hypothetical protein